MATREENLKKINDQLEKLSDEELEKVAGGGGMLRALPNGRNFPLMNGSALQNQATDEIRPDEARIRIYD